MRRKKYNNNGGGTNNQREDKLKANKIRNDVTRNMNDINMEINNKIMDRMMKCV